MLLPSEGPAYPIAAERTDLQSSSDKESDPDLLLSPSMSSFIENAHVSFLIVSLSLCPVSPPVIEFSLVLYMI